MYTVLKHSRILPALTYDMLYDIYSLQLGLHLVAVVGGLVPN
jgi:hypothetical protein